ncbi:MAG TPA: hemerythrin domain-containing protein [Nitrososphaerales archaeon]|nr:hemerythrin domain-containing protein [Nitrososphaerales archaeon]
MDYDEPLPKVLQRLKQEHKELHQKLLRIERLAADGDLKVVITELAVIMPLVLRHTIEEEARLMRPIMWEFEAKSVDSIIILRHHRAVVEFLEHKLPKLETLPERVARREVGVFVKELFKHQREEEEILFPLALKANSIHERRHRSRWKPNHLTS